MRPALTFLILTAAMASPAVAVAGVSAFDLPPGARYAALGAAATAGSAEPAGILFNPSAAVAYRGVAVNSAYGNWSGDVDQFFNAFTWSGGAGPVTVGGGLAHTRLDFKTFTPDFDYVPYNTQASFMTAAVAVGRGPVAAGVALDWNTSAGGNDDTFFDAGVRVRSPRVRAGGTHFGAALGVAMLRAGAGDEDAAAAEGRFVAGPGREQLRYGLSLELVARLAAARINTDVIDTGRDGSIDASAAGMELTLGGVVHLRAGYGDDIIAGHSAVAFGAGAGYHIGGVAVRLDYARVSAAGDDDLAANIFGARIAIDFGATGTESSR